MAARRRGSRAGTFLVLCGTVGVLSATFVAGVWTGRNWPVLVGPARAPAAGPAAARRAAPERPKAADTLPALTFYDELKAPLTAPPPPVKPTRPSRPPAELVRRDEPTEAAAPAAARPPDLPPAAAPPGAAPEGGSRFTVQVGAYNARTPADALRATLVSAGHDARVVEAVTPGGVRYRVHVGAFATRQAAQDAAARLAAERALQTFVNAR